eukprot:7280616-Pyramimonas_sp.AAC.1
MERTGSGGAVTANRTRAGGTQKEQVELYHTGHVAPARAGCVVVSGRCAWGGCTCLLYTSDAADDTPC